MSNYAAKLQDRIISRLIELHKLNQNMVNFENEDRKHAIYLLQGATITSAINIRNINNQVGMIGREWRYASEATYTIEYLDELEDDSRLLNGWFRRNGTINRKPKGGRIDSSKRQEKSKLDPTYFEQIDNLHKVIFNQLSQFAHASYKSTQGNVTVSTRSFDYYHRHPEKDQVGLDQVKGALVAEAVSAMLLPIRSLPLMNEHYLELIDYKKELNRLFAKVSSLID
jgi:hypothetical protein